MRQRLVSRFSTPTRALLLAFRAGAQPMFRHKRALLFVVAIAVGPSCAGGGCSPSDEEDDGPPAVDCNACRAGLPITGTGDVSFTNDLFSDTKGIFRRAC